MDFDFTVTFNDGMHNYDIFVNAIDESDAVTEARQYMKEFMPGYSDSGFRVISINGPNGLFTH